MRTTRVSEFVLIFGSWLTWICVEICEDIKEECEKYGKVLEMKIPRPTGGSRQSAGVGKIFIKYDVPESAGKAIRALAGRKFADRTVVTTYFSEVRGLSEQQCFSKSCANGLNTGEFRGQCLVVSPVSSLCHFSYAVSYRAYLRNVTV